MSDEPRLQTLIEEASRKFAAEIIEALRAATVNDIMAVASVAPASKRRGRPPKAKVEAVAVEPVAVAEPVPMAVDPDPEPAAEPEKPAKKKRAWPKCSADDCEKNMYGPSGQAKLCYQHHQEAGGAVSPLRGVKKKKKAVKLEPEPERNKPFEPKTILRKKPEA